MLKDKKKTVLTAVGVLAAIIIAVVAFVLLKNPSDTETPSEDGYSNEASSVASDDGVDSEPGINDDGSVDEEEKVVLDIRLDRDVAMIEMAYGEEEKPTYLEKVEELQSYKILSAEQDGDIINATVLVSAPDLYTIAKNLEVEGELTEEKINAALVEALKTATPVETEVKLIYQKINGVWEAALTEEFADAYTGGLLRLCEEYRNEVLGGADNEE